MQNIYFYDFRVLFTAMVNRPTCIATIYRCDLLTSSFEMLCKKAGNVQSFKSMLIVNMADISTVSVLMDFLGLLIPRSEKERSFQE